jgi:hypothetical protein
MSTNDEAKRNVLEAHLVLPQAVGFAEFCANLRPYICANP